MTTFMLTGGASGIGKHLTAVLLRQGRRVIATDLNIDAIEAPEKHRLDVRDPEAWERVLDAAGDVDVLMNIAGCLRPGWVHEARPEDIHMQLDVNVKGVMFGTRAAARRMAARGRGHILNFASMAALAPIPGIAVYSASKYAVRGFSLAAAQELRPRGVHVTVICPDAVRTPMLERQKDFEEAAMIFSAPRILSVEDVERAVMRALVKKPLEVFIPRGRGCFARLADLFPGLTIRLGDRLRRRGLERQAALKIKSKKSDQA